MSRKNVNLSLMLALAGLCGLALIVREDRSRPNFEFFPDMARSVPADSFSASSVFANGKAMQSPVPGTAPIGYRPPAYGPGEEEAARADEELANPFSLDDKAELRRGTELFQSFCSHCHGGGAGGDGEVALHGFPAPPSLLGPESAALGDGRIFHIITYGQKNMPGHAIQIEREDRWRIILHIRSLQMKSRESEVEAPPESEPALEPAL